MIKLYPLVVCLVAIGLVLGGFGCAKPAAPPATPSPVTSPTPATTPTTPATPTTPTTPKTPTPATSPTPAPVSFAGKTINLVVPFAAGGGTDMLARTYARFLPKYLPGKPIVLVRNMPGGDGIIGSNYVYFSKPDGHTALIQGQGPTLASLLNMPGLKFSSFTEFTACMAPPSVAELFYVGSALGWSGKPEDIANIKGIIYGGSGIYPGALFVAAKEFINIPTEKVVFGYGGAADALRAFLSGEINAVGNTSTGYYNNVRPLYEKGEVQFLFQGGMFDDAGNLVRHPVFPADVPTGPELFEKIYGKLPSGPAYEAYKAIVGGVNSISKALLLPPGTPDAVKQAYWAATKDIIKDPEFLLSANPIAGAEGEWLAGETVDRLFKQFGMKAETRDWFKDLLRAKYSVIVD